MCNCISEIRAKIEKNGYENVTPPIDILGGRAYLTFTGNKKGQKSQREIPVFLTKCPICGEVYENDGGILNANPAN